MALPRGMTPGEQAPILRDAPSRMPAGAKLRACLARLRAILSERSRFDTCPSCGVGSLRTQSVARRPVMGELGPPEFTLRCDKAECGYGEDRLYGYAGPVARGAPRFG